MRIICLFIFFLLIAVGNVLAQPQTISIDVVGIPLNKVLLDLRERYNFQFSFNDQLLSQYIITVNNQIFDSKEEALEFLISGLPLSVEKSGEVYMVIPVNEPEEKKKEIIKISGQVVEKGTYEPLPFSYIRINNKLVQSDHYGNFSFLASVETSFNMQISHLGYFIYDTTFTEAINQKFILEPFVQQLEEVTIKGNLVESSTLIGDKPGRMKINHTVAPYLPGYGDNSVYNLLRLMPGILASGEQSSELLIWGSYESHSKIEFDGFTLFGLKNFNDNIGAVNPLVIKNIEVFKGGYDVKYGDRAGGIVHVTGKNGNLQKPSFTFNINTTTVNSMLEVPVSENSSLLAAFRHTYYELYDPAELNIFRKAGNSENGQRNSTIRGIDFVLTPDYVFKDANLKYSYQGDNTNMYFSFYGGEDHYAYNLESQISKTLISREEDEKNSQFGGAFSVNHTWGSGNNTEFQLDYTTYSSMSAEMDKTQNLRFGTEKIHKIVNVENTVSQYTFSTDNKVYFLNGHLLDAGIGFQSNKVLINRILFEESLIDIDNSSQRLYTYLQDNLPISNRLLLKAGIRANYVFDLNKVYLDPRISVSLDITDELKLNLAYGIYHQYLAKTSLVDSTQNYYYFWANADNKNIPVLKGEHLIEGISWEKNGFIFNLESYYKITDGLARFVNNNLIESKFYFGKGRSYGVDLYFKKEYKNNVIWMSYTWSKSEEHFPFFPRDYYRLAPHDQRHELKIAGILNFNSFYLSANYVYGSGFEKFQLTDDDGNKYVPDYNRLDAALIYKLRPGKINGEIGLSVLNVLNAENIKLSNLRKVATGTENPLDVYAEAIPFSPTLFLKLQF